MERLPHHLFRDERKTFAIRSAILALLLHAAVIWAALQS